METQLRARLAPYERKAKLFGRRRAHQWRTWSAARQRSAPPEALVAVVSSPRCGGRLLVDYLSSVPGVAFADEILHPGIPIGYRMRARTRGAVLRHVQRSLLALPSPICGAKFTFDQLDQQRIGGEDLLGLRPEPKLIILYRRSLADTFVSLEAARQKNEWKRRDGSVPFSGSVHVDPAAYRSFAEKVRRDYEQILGQERLREGAVVIAYEDVVDAAQAVFDDVLFPFLGLGSSPVTAKLKKQIDRPLSSVVHNYDEVRDLLEGDGGRQDYAPRS